MQRFLRILYLGLNVACALVYLYAIYRVASLMRREQRTVSDAVDSVSFFVIAAPALLLALLANVTWVGKALVDVSRRHDYRAIKWLCAGVGVWVVMLLGGRFL